MLEKLGAQTCFSCEGHSNGFYITFLSPASVAERIHSCGFFSVELEGKNYWSIRINRPVTEAERKSILRYAAESWLLTFGPLEYKKDAYVNQRKKSGSRR